MPASWLNHRREADALQEALERYEGLVKDGREPTQAIKEAGRGLDHPAARLFSLTVGLRQAASLAPEPHFAETLEKRLRSATVVHRLPQRRRVGTPGAATIAAAACVAVVAGVLFGASQSLPGDSLYAFKRASESAQLAVSSGPGEARLRLDLASKRLEEVEGLVSRSGNQVFGSPGTAVAAGLDGISDPELAALIQQTLAEAEHQITQAAEILISGPADRAALDQLAEVAGRGKDIAVNVAADLPRSEVSPVLDTAVALAEVEAKAKAASEKAELPLCATPTPSPTPNPEAKPTPTPTVEPTEEPTPTPTAVEATPTPSPTPTGTPCASPSPTPTPTPTPTTSPATSPASSEQPTQPSKTTEPGNGNPDDQAQDVSAN